ncbi:MULTISPECIES: hypothetical protein [Cupriavidus]|uniref:Uncharacterized protein n=1 Tax=Cupriavidus pinatubonensis TaxID=248026 RepID=A0ABM8XEN4_9BURK|nr:MULTISPECIES: hypothetical protein [Cupriavidus]QYY32850.1 hypothetical protein K2O51_19085 [Cupriavidus pinatubonensis]TPQ38534.1 hypothetical protein C2U69_14255 [Cupriavidus pinatubonensis]CAG9178574.1 hypothetical protein LMG23994_03929 [Cupriavidus pinatubonensis]
MVLKRYHEFPAEERDAFETACARHGFVVEDFELTEDDNRPAAQRTINVGRVVGSQFERYTTADGVLWVERFERDLADDVFGFPLAD